MNPLALLKQDRAVAVLACVLTIALGAPSAERLEWGWFDLALRAAAERRPDPDIVVVTLDADSLAREGAAAWAPARIAEVLPRIASERPRVIGLLLPLPPQAPAVALDELRMLRAQAAEAPAAAGATELDAALARIESELDPHRPLLEAVLAAGPVVMAVAQDRGHGPLAVRAADGPPRYAEHRLRGVVPRPAHWSDAIPARFGLAADERRMGLGGLPGDVAQAASAVGVVAGDAPAPVGARLRALTVSQGEVVLPSFALAVAGLLEAGKLDAVSGAPDALRLVDRSLRTDAGGRVLPYWYRDGERPAFRTVDFAALRAGTHEPGLFERRAVLIGITAPDWVQTRATPVGDLAPVLAEAHTIAALRAGDLYEMPRWGVGWQVGWLACWLACAWWFAARLGTRGLMLGALGGVSLLLAAEFLALSLSALWLPSMLPALGLTAMALSLAAKRVLEGRSASVSHALSEANRMVGEAMHQKGELDRALEKYLECPPTDTLLKQMYSLGLDFERKRQFNKAAVVFDHIRKHAPGFGDVIERFQRNKQLETTVMLGTNSLGHSVSAQISAGGEARPKLGRYEVERELGKGAMGVVYLGKDPRIGRTVAIKTMPVAAEFQGPELEEVKMRFFREAETAGRLSHPGIVTVYDAGEESDLCWIAMDYLTGVPLSRHVKAGQLLEADEVFHLCIQVAEALDYAHQQKVVHRDIKPANLMYDPATRRVKITDFGVACLTDASKTKTGTILGSPSYMSPEQVGGQHVDGRSDVFALGVTFYQLLSGELPFQAGQLTTLMYKIANEPHTDIRAYNPRLAPCVSAIINGALHKDPAKRFPSAGKLAEALKACRAQKPAY